MTAESEVDVVLRRADLLEKVDYKAGETTLDVVASERASSARPLRHIAIIPDGNRRWAKEKKYPILSGHNQGFIENFPKLVRRACDHNIDILTMWLFSTDNWKRSDYEVGYLMELFNDLLDILRDTSDERGIKIRHLGREDRLPDFLKENLNKIESMTDAKNGLCLNLALNYGGSKDIDDMVKCLQNRGPDLFDLAKLMRFDLKPPDLIIRTSGEKRLSGFMPLHSTMSELYFLDKYFPDFSCDDLDEAIHYYYGRERRFGG